MRTISQLRHKIKPNSFFCSFQSLCLCQITLLFYFYVDRDTNSWVTQCIISTCTLSHSPHRKAFEVFEAGTLSIPTWLEYVWGCTCNLDEVLRYIVWCVMLLVLGRRKPISFISSYTVQIQITFLFSYVSFERRRS